MNWLGLALIIGGLWVAAVGLIWMFMAGARELEERIVQSGADDADAELESRGVGRVVGSHGAGSA